MWAGCSLGSPQATVQFLWACSTAHDANPWCQHRQARRARAVSGPPRRGQRDVTAGGHLLVSVRAWRRGCPGPGPASAVTGCGPGRGTLKPPSPGPRQMSGPERGRVEHNHFFKVIPTTVPTTHLIESTRGQKSRPHGHPARDRPTNAGKGRNLCCSHSRHPSERGAG